MAGGVVSTTVRVCVPLAELLAYRQEVVAFCVVALAPE